MEGLKKQIVEWGKSLSKIKQEVDQASNSRSVAAPEWAGLDAMEDELDDVMECLNRLHSQVDANVNDEAFKEMWK